MKSFNFWRSLFFSALAVMSFSACSDDDNSGSGDVDAAITVNGEKAAMLGIKGEGGETEAVSVVSAGAWTLAFEEDQDWCEASATAGNGGTSTLTFTVAPMPADVEERSATAVLSTPGQVFGVPYTETAKITIQQSASGEVVTPVLIYKETFGTDANVANTDVDKYTDWTKTGEGAADVTYIGTNVSVRKSNPNNSNSYEGASGAPILFFGKVPATFIVQNISLTSEQTRLQLTFGGQQTIDYTAKDFTWSNENLLVALSADGTTWSTIEYTANDGDQNSEGKNWVLATADFTLKAPTEKLFIRFLSPILASNLRIDDITLQTGIGGQEVDLAAGDPVPTVTISEIAKAGDYEVKDATVIANYAAGFLMQDPTGIMLVYPGSDATIPAAGKVVTVKGAVAAYGGVFQFGQGSVVTETGEGTVPAVPEATEITADNIAELMTAPKITYVKTTGTLTVDEKYRNLVFTFDTSYKGSIVAPAADAPFDLTALDGELVDIAGWFLNNSNGSTFLSILAMEVKENTTTPTLVFTTKPEVFAGSNPEPQTITFSAQNIPTDQIIDFAFTGADADKFDVQKEGDNSVVIKAVGNNASSTAYSAMLVATYDSKTLAELSVSQNPADIKNYVPFTAAPADWSGEYIVGYPDATNKKCNIVNGRYNATGSKSTFTYTTLESPAFDGTKIVYDASYNTITVAKIEGTEFYSLKYGDAYVGWESTTGNNCQFKATAPTAADTDYQWTIKLETVDNVTLVVLTVVTTKDQTKPRQFQFNATAGQERFAIYAATQKNVMLYQLEK
ncbi:MAG: hypothetical protein K2L09_02085 [Alistipes sp.]|nr:hypothetical protein [Alistipes sp.]